MAMLEEQAQSASSDRDTLLEWISRLRAARQREGERMGVVPPCMVPSMRLKLDADDLALLGWMELLGGRPAEAAGYFAQQQAVLQASDEAMWRAYSGTDSVRPISTPTPLLTFPARWDWRERGVVSPVGDQGDCGACYAFATIANIESKMAIDSGRWVDLSENQAKACIWSSLGDLNDQLHGGCAGGNAMMVANLLSLKGTVLEECDPYVARASPCTTGCAYQKTVLGWSLVEHDQAPDPAELKRALLKNGPLSAQIFVGEGGSWETEYSQYDGSYTLFDPSEDAPNHDVLLVGWDDTLTHDGGAGAWVFKESAGTRWGDDGYGTIAYGSASLGQNYSFLTEWQEYDPTGEVLHYDEASWDSRLGYESTTGWVLGRFTPDRDSWATRVEFWTTDRTLDVDVFVYDSFNGAEPSTLLFEKENLCYDEAGYHSVRLDPPLRLRAGDEVVAVLKLTNATSELPIAIDKRGPLQHRVTYASPKGLAGSWRDLASSDAHPGNAGIRLRTSANDSITGSP
jgi:C1A family cysteine protease